ncbi:MAG: hypothetical protein GC185_07730 [Alphaproteobacteria bacterium]|nr:hypothetical protein [Alphaproteobacteria bacterium]
MSNMKSQFVTGTGEETRTTQSGGHADFLKASLGLMVAPSLDGQAKSDLEFMKSYVAENPGATNTARFNGYVEKITRAHEAPKQQTTMRAKPMGGGMM